MARSRDLSKVLSSSTAVATDSELALVPIIPTSVTVTSGTSSIGTNGLVTFTSASAVSLNGIFTSSYTNYRAIVNMDAHSVSGDVVVRLRNSGSDNSSSVYGNAVFYMNSGGSYGGGVIGATGTYWTISYLSSAVAASNYILEFFNPQVSKQTGMTSWQVRHDSTSNGTCEYRTGTHVHGTSASYDSATVYSLSGTMTGTVKFYGYKN